MSVPKLRFREFDGDWTGLKIIDLVKSLDAGVSVNSEDVEPKEDEYSVLKTSCISSGYFDENERKRVLQDGEIQRLKEPVLDDSILMSRMNTPLLVGMNAYVFKAPKNTFLPDRLWQLKIDDNKTVTRWLAFYLGSDQGLNQIRDLASGTSNSMKNITKPDVLNIDLFAPQKEEQTKIASFLSAVDEKISQLTQKHELLSQYKQGMMQKLFSQQIRFKADDGSEFGEWASEKISKVFTNKSKSFNPLLNESLPCIELEHLSPNTGQILGTVNSSDQQSTKNLFEPNSVLYGKLRPYLRKFAKPQFKGVCSSEIWVLTGLKISNDYLFQFVQSEQFTELTNIQSGSKMPRADWNVIADSEIEFPCLEEQTKIANFLSAIDQKVEVVAQQIKQAKTWKKGLLQQMFV